MLPSVLFMFTAAAAAPTGRNAPPASAGAVSS